MLKFDITSYNGRNAVLEHITPDMGMIWYASDPSANFGRNGYIQCDKVRIGHDGTFSVEYVGTTPINAISSAAYAITVNREETAEFPNMPADQKGDLDMWENRALMLAIYANEAGII